MKPPKKVRPRAFNSTLAAPDKPMRKMNPDRIKKLRAKQFGTDGKREWVLTLRCGVTGLYGWPENPMEPAHTGSPNPDEREQSTRGSGADETYLLPMLHFVHRDFDTLDEAKWIEKYGISKQAVREDAAELHGTWVKAKEEETGEVE